MSASNATLCRNSTHTQQSLLAVLEFEVLVLKLVAVNALATSAIAIGEVTALDHELLDHTVECGALVAEAILSCCESSKVLSCLLSVVSIPVSQHAC